MCSVLLGHDACGVNMVGRCVAGVLPQVIPLNKVQQMISTPALCGPGPSVNVAPAQRSYVILM